jgi:hypothetical protein
MLCQFTEQNIFSINETNENHFLIKKIYLLNFRSRFIHSLIKKIKKLIYSFTNLSYKDFYRIDVC